MRKIDDQIHTFRTSLGWMSIVGCGGLLRYLTFGYSSAVAAELAVTKAWPVAIRPAKWSPDLADQLRAYARGDLVDFLPAQIDAIDLTPFQRKVVRHCRRIPRGATLTYGELARRAGSPRAARAVGGVMRANRFPLVVPCHRVVGADGRLGGFSAAGGIKTKRRLLLLERDDRTTQKSRAISSVG